MNISLYIQERSTRINRILTDALPAIITAPTLLHQAMHSTVTNGGKRMRPLILYATGESLGAQLEQLDNLAAAIELIHAYSLIHDDLPAMDNAALRRGKPSCHIAFGEATAILVGDALLPLAFELISTTTTLPSKMLIQMITILSKASGSIGMVGGQVLDLIAEKRAEQNTKNSIDDLDESSLDLNALKQIHHKKTGALITASLQLGVLSATASYEDKDENKNIERMKSLSLFSEKIGLAYQIQDDILDIEGDTEHLGKEQGTDAKLNKQTYPNLVGMDQAKQDVLLLFLEAKQILEKLNLKDSYLDKLTDFIFKRNH